jgi:hypothetical protein
VLPISDELAEDAVQIQTYLNSRLSMFVSLETASMTGSSRAKQHSTTSVAATALSCCARLD